MKQRDQPHDRYFKDLMEDVLVAKEFLMTYLDQDIQTQIDWDTLTPYDTTLIGGYNKQLYADVIYKAYTKKHRTELFFVINHERKPDKLTPIRTLEYALGVLKKSIKQKEGKPAFIIHLTWHNFKRGAYTPVKSIADYFEERELASKLLLQSCQIINPHELADEELIKHEHTNVLALFMKYADDPNFPQWLVEHPAIANKLSENKYIERSIEYILDVGYHKYEELLLAFAKTSDKLKQTMLTTRQQIEQIGEKRGKQQGIQTRNLEIARNLLHKNMDVSFITETTGLDKTTITKLKEDKA